MKRFLCWFSAIMAVMAVLAVAAYFFFKEKPEYCPACLKKISQGRL